MKSSKWDLLKKQLEEVHREFVESNEIQNDALAPALRYTNKQDMEFAAFICAVLAYGKVAHIKASCNKILAPLGDTPVEFLIKNSPAVIKKITRGWCHRFNTQDDMWVLLVLLKQIYTSHGSLEAFLDPQTDDTAELIFTRFHERLRKLDVRSFKKMPPEGTSFWFFLPHPSKGGACKRLNLFLRWMVGKSEMDLGLWNSFQAKNLIIPVDTHVLNQARKLRFTSSRQANWKTAVEITNKLKNLDPDDPTRFDFALCHLGIRKLQLRS